MIITTIGGGNMAGALIGGLAAAGANHEIRVADPDADARARLVDAFGVTAYEDAVSAAAGADTVVLAIKPQVLPTVMTTLGPSLVAGQTLVSVAAGVTLATLHRYVGADVPAVRTMPNTPALLGLGITGLYADDRCGEEDQRAAELVMGACGETVWLEAEEQLDALTAISGSGPAYFFLFMEALADAGAALGLPSDVAAKLATHTARGAGAMAVQNEAGLAELRRRVTSPGGTTQAAIETFEAGGLRQLVEAAATAAEQRSRELAKGGSDA
jgi:pyrroline-5-carboxylate reductase